MRFRAATLNLEQDHKRWDARREIVVEQVGAVRPDLLALNEVCLPRRTAHWLRDAARERLGIDYHLVQQTRVNFNQPDPRDHTLWPSDHAGVWADLELQG